MAEKYEPSLEVDPSMVCHCVYLRAQVAQKLEVFPLTFTKGLNEDSDYLSTGYDTSTESLSSSVAEYILENGLP